MKANSQVLTRIEQLYKMAEEEGEELNSESVDDCVRFFSSGKNYVLPDIVSTPSGRLLCYWNEDLDRQLTIQFIGGKSIYYDLTAPSFRRRAITRTAGECDLKQIDKIIKQHDVDWVLK